MNEQPWAVLTGDTLFVGDVARPDLAIEKSAGARGIFRSLTQKLLTLPGSCGGGTILALPVLVYALGEQVGPASTASLIVIAIAAGIGAGALAFRGHVCWRIAATFSLPAAAGSLLGTLGNNAYQ